MAVRFSADGQDYTSTSVPPGNVSTVACWVKLAADRNTYSTVWSSDANNTSAYMLLQTAADGTTLTLSQSGVDVTGPALTVGSWYRVAVVRSSATNVTLYAGAVGAALTAYSSTSFTSLSPLTFRVGESSFTAEWLNGAIAGLKQYDVALTVGEIEAELGQYQPVRTDGLVRWHPFVAAETVDYSGNGRTLSGGTGATSEDGPPIRWARARGPRVTMSSGPQDITPTGIASGEAVGSPTVTTGAVSLSPTGIASGEAVGSPTVVPSLSPTGIASAESFGAPTVTVGPAIFPTSIASAESFGSPSLTVGGVFVQPTGIASGEAFGSVEVTVTFDTAVVLGRPQERLQVTYELVCVARIPQASGPPTFLEIDPIEWKTLTWSSTLSRPQELTATCPVTSITEPVAQRLRNPDRLPTELWLLRDGQRVFAGPLLGGRRSGETVTLNASGLLTYLQWMIVVADLRFDQIDQLTMAAALVDQWQALPYGNFGIDTADVGLSGRLRDGSYIRNEIHNVGKRVEELGARNDGFDVEVDPTTRKLQLWYPGKGVDRSTGADAVVFDDRNITSSEILFSVAPGDLATEAFGSGSSAGGDSPLWSEQSNMELRAAFGRAAVTGSWSDVSEQTTLDDHTLALLDARDRALVVPGPQTRVTADADLSTYAEGDTVSFELDSALGMAGAFRIRRREVQVAENGSETVDIEFV